jgi:glucose-specific phosphotransferase system IIA component
MMSIRHVIASPVSGRTIPLEQVDDEVLSSGLVGEGQAIEPSDGTVLSPADGRIVRMASTKHAFGIDTVGLAGEPFEAKVATGDHVTCGDVVMKADLESIRQQGISALTSVLITNYDDDEEVTAVQSASDEIRAGDPLLVVCK